MATDCSHWNEYKALPTKCICNSGKEADKSWQRSVKRKFEGLSLECNHSCDENLFSAQEGTLHTTEDVGSEDIQCNQFNRKCSDTLSNDSPTQPNEGFRNSAHACTGFILGTSIERTHSRTYGPFGLTEEKEELNSLCSNAQCSSFSSVVNHISPKKTFMEKKGAARNMADRETGSHSRMVEVENEVFTLREALRSQHQALQDLYTELEEERNSSSTAANETLAMILRLQEEKAAVRLEADQYKRLAEEKLAHDRESLAYFEDLIHRKDEEIAALECEVQAYRHRLLSIGFDDLEIGKIRWPGRSYPNDREEDCDSWTSSCTEKLEGFDGYDPLSWRTPNNAEQLHSRDMLQRQDKKGTRHISMNDRRCLNDTWINGAAAVDSCQPQLQWGEVCSKRVTCGQDRTLGNSHRIQAEDYFVSKKINKESTKEYSKNGSKSHASYKMDSDCKVTQGYDNCDVDLEPDISTSQLKEQDAVSEMTMDMRETALSNDNLTLWEQIEKLEDRLQLLSKRRAHNCHVDDEWVATNKELRKTVVAYTASLREGARSRWRLSSDNTGICDGLMRAARGESAEDLQPSSVFAINKQTAEVSNTVIEVPLSNKNLTDVKAASDEIDLNSNVHDVHVVQQEGERTRRYDSHKGTAFKFDIVVGDRLGKPEPLPQKHQEDSSLQDPDSTERILLQSALHNVQVSKAGDSLCNASSGGLVGSKLDPAPLQGQVEQLSVRLQALESDREFMKQTIDSLKREKEELTLLKDIAQRLRELKPPSKSPKVVKSTTPQEDPTVLNLMKGILSFNILRNNMHKSIGSCNNVGLSHVLENTPTRRMSTCLTRVVKVNSFLEVRNGRPGKATEAALARNRLYTE